MKKIIKNILKYYGYNISKIKKEVSFDEIIKKNLPNNPTIFDIGANEGQSITRFKKIFEKFQIHAFEPNIQAFQSLKKNYGNYDKIFLNDLAVGEKKDKRKFFETKKTTHSSFYKINEKSEWIKMRSKEHRTSIKGYTERSRDVDIISLDEYCKTNLVKKIDLLKIDTQGYEEQVLNGCSDLIKNKLVNLIETEIMLDDVYDRNINIYDLEKFLKDSHKLIGIKPKSFNNIYEGYVFSLDLIYKKKNEI